MTITSQPTSTGTAAGGRDFQLFWFGEGVSLLGSSTSSVLIPLLAIGRFQAGPSWMGALTAASWLPWLVIGLPAGAWVDRLPARAVMIAADLVSAAALLWIPVAWWLGALRLPQLLAVAFLGGVATVFFRAAYVKLLPAVVPGRQLESANARLFGTESAMQIAGPGLGGLIAQWLSAAFGVVFDALSFLVSAGCLCRIRPTRTLPAKPAGAGLAGQIGEGIRLVARDRNLRVLTVIGGISNFGLTGYAALLVLFFVRRLGMSSASVGLVLAIGSCGGLLGAALATRIAARLGNGRASTVLLLIGGPAALLIGLPASGRTGYLSAAGLLLVGAAVVAGNVIRGAWRLRYVPSELMGRVLTTSQVVNFGTMPVAALVAGWLASRLGVRPTILIMAGVHALACWSILLTRLGRCRQLPEPATR